MFKRKKAQVQPALDPYITRRYEDLAVCIHQDLKNGRGLYSYYAPWLETMLQRLPSAEMRQKYSLLPANHTTPASAWVGEDEAGPSNRTAAKAVHDAEEPIETIYIDDPTGPKAPYKRSNITATSVFDHPEVRSGQRDAECMLPEIPPLPTARQNQSRLCIIL